MYAIFFTGIAFSLLRTTCRALQGQYFDKYYPLAAGVCEPCIDLGIIIFPPLTKVLLGTYGWRNSLLLIGAISFPTTKVFFNYMNYDE